MLMIVKPQNSERAVNDLLAQAEPVWCAVYTSIGCERKAQHGIEDLGYGTFLPVYRKINRFAKRSKPKAWPLVSRYVFVAMPPFDEDWGEINHVDGVERLLTNNDKPMVIAGRDMERLRQLVIDYATGRWDDGVTHTIREAVVYKKPGKRKQLKRRQRPRRNRTVRRMQAMLDAARSKA